jgi:opacity protein-like surface antigen
MINAVWGAGVDLNYHRWEGNDDFYVTTPAEDWSFDSREFTAHAKYHFQTDGSLKPWLKGGLGIYNTGSKVTLALGESDDRESDLGFSLGGGLNLLSSPTLAYGIGAAFHSIQTEGDATTMVTVTLSILFGVGGP